MNKNIGIIIGILIIAGIGFFIFSGEKTEKENIVKENQVIDTEQIQNETVSDVPEILNETPTNEVQMPDQPVTQEILTISVGSYESYSAEKIAMAETGDVVLFFHASWCPSCRALNGDIEDNMSEIPAGITILKTDYDKETELKKKYGVTTQHTLVQVDKDGNLVKKWSGGSKLENLLSQIQ